jgi:prepilin-type N-terminal cleavage/methylation domain-containing protein
MISLNNKNKIKGDSHKGFTLIELLIVMAISVILIMLVLFGTKGLQSQAVLSSSVSNFVSRLSYIKEEAVSGVTSFYRESIPINPTTGLSANWVYGFYVIPATSATSICSSNCPGYDVVMAVKNAQPPCQDQNSNKSPTSDNSIPPQNNSLYNNYPSGDTYSGSVTPLNKCLGGSITPTNATYYHALSPGVTISSNGNFPLFEEISGDVYIYSESHPYSIVSSPGTGNNASFTMKYTNSSEDVTIYDTYSSNANSVVQTMQ